MREHQRKLREEESNTSPRMTNGATAGVSSACPRDDDRSDVGSSSAQDQGSEGSDVTVRRQSRLE